MPLSQADKAFLAIVKRSPISDDGWYDVSKQLWPLTESAKAAMPDLMDIDPKRRAVRLTTEGRAVLKYLL